MPFLEPLGVYFGNLDSTEAVFVLASGETVTVSGCFDDAFLDANAGETRFDTTQPRFTCEAAKVAKVKEDDTVTIKGTVYGVAKDPMPEGTGTATVLLRHE